MGWKNVKEHYRIGHIVHITDEGLCVGSPYIHNLIVVSMEGKVTSTREAWNDDLRRYLREFDADPEKLRRLIESQDHVSASVPVYTYEGAKIIEKQCEKPGWPNVTHDGCLMYDNTFSENRDTIVERAKRDAASGVSLGERRVSQLRDELAEAERGLAQDRADLVVLNATEGEGD